MAMLGHLLDVGDARAQPMAAESRYRCAATLTGHTFDARRRRPVEQSPSKQRVQVLCAAALSDGRVVSGSNDRTLKVWDASTSECLRTLTGHTRPAQRRRPVDTTRRLLVDAATGAGQVCRRPAERPHRV